MTEEEHANVSLLKRVELGNLAGAAELFAEDFVWHFFNPRLPEVQDYVGLAGLQTLLMNVQLAPQHHMLDIAPTAHLKRAGLTLGNEVHAEEEEPDEDGAGPVPPSQKMVDTSSVLRAALGLPKKDQGRSDEVEATDRFARGGEDSGRIRKSRFTVRGCGHQRA